MIIIIIIIIILITIIIIIFIEIIIITIIILNVKVIMIITSTMPSCKGLVKQNKKKYIVRIIIAVFALLPMHLEVSIYKQ